ncbi:uncharacterized protein RCC_00425 [Ramularia collo-cygni]|uniref:Uncharacterized protein n=1 Tax=Ramularia collo-cygni TaxID=112498 RepID=A0A2D3UMZ2_9PEZI|nr:uncharacterized protein RCC_00425 [Ramularia collo-cygni]CZT14448.1 uncharacterized protein RCC_00425 [Ramularia collo-cygni]
MKGTTRLLCCIIVLLFSSPFVSATIGFGTCKRCLPIAIHDAPGVGFDLTASYGSVPTPCVATSKAHMCDRVASVNLYDGPKKDTVGTMKDIVKVEASQEYKDLIVRLSTAPAPGQGFVGSAKRWFNELVGYSNSKDVAILSTLIAQLKNSTEVELGVDLRKIVVTHPRFPALTAENMGNAIKLAGLQSWLHGPNDNHAPNQLSENRAALAAHGFNLCQEEGSWMICIEKMEVEVGEVNVYFASLSNDTLYTSWDRYLQPFEYIGDHEPHFFDSRSGLKTMAKHHSDESYWTSIRDKLVPWDIEGPISHVFVGGEAAMMPEFRKAVHDALANFTVLDFHDDGMGNNTIKPVPPLYAASRGGALLARWRQEAPIGCWEARECAGRRAQEREGFSVEEVVFDKLHFWTGGEVRKLELLSSYNMSSDD